MLPPAVTVHGPADARRALAPGLPVTLLSAEGAAGGSATSDESGGADMTGGTSSTAVSA